jgi:hypothetical protein
VLRVASLSCAWLANAYPVRRQRGAPIENVIGGVWSFTLMMPASVAIIYVLLDVAPYIPFKL